MLSKNLTRILPLQSAVASGSVSAALARVYSSAPTKSKKAPVFPEKSWPSGVDPAFDVAQNTTGHITWKNSAFAKLGLYDAPELPIEEKQAMEEKANAKAKAEEQSRNGNRAADGADRKKGKSFDFLEIGDDLMDLVREFQKDNQKTLAESASEKAAKKAAASSIVDHKSLAYPQFLFRPTDADFASDSVVTAQLREHRGGSTEDVEEWEEITQNLSICPMTGRHLSELTPAELRRVEIYDHEFIRHQSIMRYRLFGAYSRFIFEKFPQRAHEERLKRHTADIQTSAPVNINYLLPPRARSEEYRYRGKPLQCDLSQPGAIVDYKNTKLLARYLSEEGRILPRRKTGLSAKMQRQVTNAIKRARQCHLIPYTGKPWRAYPENSFNHQMGRMSEHEVYTTGDQTRSKYMDLRDAMRQKEAQLKLDNAKSTAKSNLGWV